MRLPAAICKKQSFPTAKNAEPAGLDRGLSETAEGRLNRLTKGQNELRW
jgi:hypothetical protein